MSKREIIERIQRLNPTAQPEFLASFSDEDLLAYLQQLQEVAREKHRPTFQAPLLAAS
ncbi:MAG: hypothetical protein AMXMBFR13_28220 [Phycisphaerae bacterium]